MKHYKRWNKPKERKLDNNLPEKINKFDVFRKGAEGEQEKTNLNKEERAKKTRENRMHKLNLKKYKLLLFS